MRYVLDEIAEMARIWERRFAEIREDAGVLFVGVEPEPVEGGRAQTFTVHLGLSRSFEESAGVGLIQKVLEREISLGVYNIKATIHRGIPCLGAQYRLKPLDTDE